MSIRLTLPTGMELRDWADQVVLDLDPYGTIGKLDNEERWQDWAVQFLNISTLKDNLPIPYFFSDWREWAERLCQVAR